MRGRKGLVLGSSLLAILVAAGAALTLAGPARAASARTQFSSYIDDLPIMPGLAESDQGYAFDLYQGGRLAESRLSGQADASVVRSFYTATLAQLGWKPAADAYTYHRGRERLIFLVDPKTARGRAAGLDVIFVVTPDPDPSVTPAVAPAPAPAAAVAEKEPPLF
jgi:hypothetical protein